MIGSFSQIPYTKFAVVLGPIALIGLIVTVAPIALFHRDEFAGTDRLKRGHGRLMPIACW